MNCRRTQQLLSPYLDQRLTGQQMLEVKGHLDNCPSCLEEYLVIKQVKSVLRSMPVRDGGPNFEDRIRTRIEADRAVGFPALAFALERQHGAIGSLGLLNSPRGRRMATALAFSCVGILSVAAQLGNAEKSPRSFAALEGSGFINMNPATAMVQSFADATSASRMIPAGFSTGTPPRSVTIVDPALIQQRDVQPPSGWWYRARPDSSGFTGQYVSFSQPIENSSEGGAYGSPAVTIASFSH